MEFSDIALAKLLQTVPELGSMIITFQDVTDELPEDNGTQVGIFVLRSGEDLFYIPAVSKGDSVYPLDSVFFDVQKKFFPLTKKTVALITASSQMTQGKPARIPKTVIRNPSVYELINPPRTGKYVYASASRLTEFLGSLPDRVKQATFEKIAAEKSLYDNLDKLFGLKAIFDVLKPSPGGAAAKVSEAPISVVTEANPQLGNEAISQIIRDGYAIQGIQHKPRFAVSIQDYNKDGSFQCISQTDSDKDYTLVLNDGTTREAFIPKVKNWGQSNYPKGTDFHKESLNVDSLAIFTNGDFAVGNTFIATGDNLDRKKVLTTLFDYQPPVLLRDCEPGDTIIVSLRDGSFTLPIVVNRISFNSYGVTLQVSGYGSNLISCILGYRDFPETDQFNNGELYVPYNCIVLKLNNNITGNLETGISTASTKRSMMMTKYLGTELNLGFDGIEFSVNGSPIGPEAKVMEVLVVHEGISPNSAKSFVKEARLTKLAKIYLTKAAESTDYSPTDPPQYGITVPDQQDYSLPNQNLVTNVQDSAGLGDSQVTEATIISELLQVPDMFEEISEYLPAIEEAIDKLGRILLISRIHIDKLSQDGDPDNVFSFLASMKSVYRLLGDNFLKLQELSSPALAVGQDESNK